MWFAYLPRSCPWPGRRWRLAAVEQRPGRVAWRDRMADLRDVFAAAVDRGAGRRPPAAGWTPAAATDRSGPGPSRQPSPTWSPTAAGRPPATPTASSPRSCPRWSVPRPAGRGSAYDGGIGSARPDPRSGPIDKQPSDAIVFFSGDLAYKQIFPPCWGWSSATTWTCPSSGWPGRAGTWPSCASGPASVEQRGKVDEEAFDKLSSLLLHRRRLRRPRTFQRLRKALGDAERPLHYLAIPPTMFATVTEGLAAAKCIDGGRVIVEKPFGRDLASAVELNQVLHRHLPEDRIFRMDHFLGKADPEHPLPALRQRPAGAGLERPLRPPDADHHGRGLRRPGPRRLLRGGRGDPRRPPEPPAPGAGPAGHGRPRGPCPRRHPQGALPAHPGHPAAGPLQRGPGPVPRLPRRARGGPRLGGRDLCGRPPGHRHLALVGGAFYIRAGKRLPVTDTEVLVEFRRPPWSCSAS